MRDFELVSHTADIKIRVFGKSLKDLFRNALVGMFQSIGPHASGCKVTNGRLVCPSLPVSHFINVSAIDLPNLLIDFLSEALYLSDVHNEAYLDATIDELNERHIKAKIYGIVVERFEVVEIKAVTYHGLQIKQISGLWQTEIVFDI
jgi:SHS2 domain-containing protein